MDKRKEVLLVCSSDGFHNLLRIPRILSEAGCNVSLLTIQDNLLVNSRYVDFILPLESDIHSLIISLKIHLAKNLNRYAWILIGDEAPLFEIVKYKGDSWIEGWFPVDVKSEAINIISSKDSFAKACMSHGIPFPKTHVCLSAEHALAETERIGYPVMLKTIQGSSGISVRSAKNPDELLAAYKSICSPAKFLLQKLETGCVGVTEMLLDHGEPLAWNLRINIKL